MKSEITTQWREWRGSHAKKNSRCLRSNPFRALSARKQKRAITRATHGCGLCGGGMNFSTSSLNRISPPCQCSFNRENSKHLRNHPPPTHFRLIPRTNNPEPLTATESTWERQLAFLHEFFNERNDHPRMTFPSISRTSSPGGYSRTSSKFLPCPLTHCATLPRWSLHDAIRAQLDLSDFLRISRGSWQRIK